jgi:hypothetical protein
VEKFGSFFQNKERARNERKRLFGNRQRQAPPGTAKVCLANLFASFELVGKQN